METRQSTAEQVRAFLLDKWKHGPSISDFEYTKYGVTEVVEIVTDLLAAREREVWLEAAQYIGANSQVAPHIGPLWNVGWNNAATSFANYCRQQAKEIKS